jgi:hypothetical protein
MINDVHSTISSLQSLLRKFVSEIKLLLTAHPHIKATFFHVLQGK